MNRKIRSAVLCTAFLGAFVMESRAASDSVTLIAGGDVLLDRGVAQQITRHGGDMRWPFSGVRPLLRSADIAFANLECPLSARGVKVLKPFSFKADPKTAVGLRDSGLDWLSLANNHTLDCGRPGLLETMRTLDAASVNWCGAGQNAAQSQRAKFQTVKGIRFAWLAWSEFLPEGVFSDPGKANIALASDDAIRREIRAARRRADVVVVSFHWGIEYNTRPSIGQIAWGRLAARSGADLVLGAHPHVVQPLEIVRHGTRRSLIAYSLGNLVFDAPRSWDRRTRETILLRCTFTRRGLQSVRAIPLSIEKTRPRPASKVDGRRILHELARLSAERGVTIRDGVLRF